MNPTIVAIIFFVCALCGLLAGIRIGRTLPASHLQAESKESIRTAIGLIATMTALVLGLVTASAKQSFDDVDKIVHGVAADVLTLDGILVRYGPEAAPVRERLKAFVAARVHTAWPERTAPDASLPKDIVAAMESLASEIQSLVPKDESRARLKSRATDLAESLMEVRFRSIGRVGSSVPTSFLVVLALWLAVTFTSFGMFAPLTRPVIAVQVVCAASVAAAVFLVLELDGPFGGLVRVSADPLVAAIAHMNR